MADPVQPCPFCGETERLFVAREAMAGSRIACPCGGRGPTRISEQARADAWNQRAADSGEAR